MYLLPPNSTDVLQPMDISVNKPAKVYLRNKFQLWYSEKVLERIEEENVDAADITLIKMGLPIMRELGAKWMVQMAEYLSDNPQFIVNGFIRSGISKALDGYDDRDSEESDQDSECEELSDEDSESSGEESRESMDEGSLDEESMDEESLDEESMDEESLDEESMDEESLDEESLDEEQS